MKTRILILLLFALFLTLRVAPTTDARRLAASPIPAPFVAYGVSVAVTEIEYIEARDSVIVWARTSWRAEEIPFIFHNIRGRGDVALMVAEAVRVTVPPVGVPFFASLTVFPDPGKPGTTSVDGDIGTNASSPYSTAHSTADCASGTGTECSGTTLGTTENSGTAHNGSLFPCNTRTYSVIRYLLNFDTSGLGSTSTVTAATLSVKPFLVSINTESDFVRVVTNSGASSNNYSTSDFSSFGTTGQASDINVSSLSAGTYTDFTLNATGLSNVSKTGISKFALRAGMDVNNTEPTPPDSDCITNSSEGTIVFYNSADASGTSDDPKLTITFTPAGGRKRTVEIGR